MSTYLSRESIERENTVLKDKLADSKKEIDYQTARADRAEEQIKQLKEKHNAELAEKDAIIVEMANTIAHLKAVAGHDGTNTGTPTSATPLNKKKVIPNGRQPSGKARGGQQNHEKHSFQPPAVVDEVEEIVHEMGPDDDTTECEEYDGEIVYTGRIITKEEYDVKIIVIKKEHQYKVYRCVDSGKEVHVPIDNSLKESAQYGCDVQALALSLMVTGNVTINKTAMLIRGMTDNRLCLSEGFLCKLYRRAAGLLEIFIADLKRMLIQRTLIYWDDTVIMINTARACMRFYGDETIALYTVHEHKDLKGLVEDGILTALTSDNTVMHDHNKVNYNERFSFENIECNQHLERDLQRVADDNPKGHNWAGELKTYLSATMKERQEKISMGDKGFSKTEIKKFHSKIDRLIKKGTKENIAAVKASKLAKPTEELNFEKNLLERLEQYKDNYFRWVEDFSLPTTDNLSERSLRGVKGHLKASGQFNNLETALCYAIVKTYTETCRRNGINEMEALKRLCNGDPYTVEEIFSSTRLQENKERIG